jgi:hypothetical protein
MNNGRKSIPDTSSRRQKPVPESTRTFTGADSFDRAEDSGNDDSQDLYPTTDIYFAAYLKTIDVPFYRVNRSTSGQSNRVRLEFVFDISRIDDFNSIKDDYFIRGVDVSSSRFVENIKSFKAMCYS